MGSRASVLAMAVFTVTGISPCVVGSTQEKGKAPPACANPATNPDVWLLRSGGLWKQDSAYGNFRVLVVRKGVEHALDHVEVQVTSIVDDDTTAIRHCSVVPSPGLKGYVTDVSIRSVDDRWAAIELDVEMKAMDGIVLKEVFLASSDGQVLPVVEAKYVDLFNLKRSRSTPTAPRH